MRTRASLLILTALTAPQALLAAPHSASGIILTYDLNQDQKLPLEEFVAARRDRFAATDTDNNGIVDESEYVYEWEGKITQRFAEDRKASVKQTHVRFKAIDKDEDGFISPEELNAIGQRGFDYMDADKDGLILASDPEPKRRGESDKKDKKADEKPQRTLAQRPLLRMPTTHSIKGFMDLYDSNGDEKVTQEEFQNVRDEHFKRSDENNDGLLTEQEYVLEFEDRLDKQIEKSYEAQVKQAYVRFGVLDKNEDKAMTFSEYMQSGFRSFTRHDTNEDGLISLEDPIYKRKPKSESKKDEDKQGDTATVIAKATR
ncbi:EF-hand domain-containing protein [Planctobacterium marinum]|uniref:calcium-binding protein n=1 Tax=Planctobacterium marinum TaxID=1631968 RepID=UPI001E5FEB4D|nr:calcium-binding protein [Planctobacterium marinum]MCC2603955.1 calcium-binding protein [Planctobacterium marinum]